MSLDKAPFNFLVLALTSVTSLPILFATIHVFNSQLILESFSPQIRYNTFTHALSAASCFAATCIQQSGITVY